MKELSLNILDIVQNSISAQATLVKILLAETEDTLRITIEDDGKGMTPEFLATVMDPFSTTRKTRKVGMGIPLFKPSWLRSRPAASSPSPPKRGR